MVDRKSKALFQAIGKESRLLSVADLNTKTKWTTTSNTELAQGGFARIYSGILHLARRLEKGL